MDSNAGVQRCNYRSTPPAHFIHMIRSFSILSETSYEKHESGVFQACDKKWKLCVYPKGNKKANGEDHISLYLQIVDTESFPLGWEVHAKFTLFVYDHICDKYLTVEYGGGEMRRFNFMKTEWGFDRLLPLFAFNDPANGYLVDDACAFGAEVLVVSNAATKRECFSMVKEPTNKTYTWRILNYKSKIKEDCILSDVFIIEGIKWRMWLFPKGFLGAKGKCLSIFVELVESSELTPHHRKLYAKYKLRICDQLNNQHHDKQVECYYGGSPAVTFKGSLYFIYPDKLDDATCHFLVNDTLVVEVDFMYLSKFVEF